MIIENDAYLMELSCYIHRNPLGAGIVKRLADYRWSSYLADAYGRQIRAGLVVDKIDSIPIPMWRCARAVPVESSKLC
jgi:hypothetical protein